jgi:hypothetical protein
MCAADIALNRTSPSTDLTRSLVAKRLAPVVIVAGAAELQRHNTFVKHLFAGIRCFVSSVIYSTGKANETKADREFDESVVNKCLEDPEAKVLETFGLDSHCEATQYDGGECVMG